MRIDVWSDIVCPWCAIGRKRLADALRAEGVQAEVVHRAFELDPTHRAARPTREVLAERYGGRDVGAMMRRVRELGAAEGLDLRTEEAVSANTFDAHRLLLWAQAQGKGDAMMRRLVEAHFTRSLDLSDHGVLAGCAVACGLDAAAAREALASDAFAAQVRADEEEAHALGVTGVPFFVLDRRLGVSGAQDVAVFRSAIAQARQAQA